MRDRSRRRWTSRRASRCGSSFKPVLKTPDEIRQLCRGGQRRRACVGLITWMHTFSPAKMWIAGLQLLQKPFAAPAHPVQPRHPVGRHRHGLHEPEPVRARRPRVRVHRRPHAAGAQGRRRPLAGRATCSAASARGRAPRARGRTAQDARRSRASATTCARSPSPKATRSRRRGGSGFSVNGYGVGDLVRVVDEVVRRRGRPAGRQTTSSSTRRAARCGRAATGASRCATARASSSGLRQFLEDGGFKGVHRHVRGPARPGAAARAWRPQRLMAEGYGFGGEGDWKTAALVRAMKVMARGLREAAPRSWRTTPTT